MGNKDRIPRTQNPRERDAWRRQFAKDKGSGIGTANRLVEYDVTKELNSVEDLTKYILGFGNEISVADLGDGTVRISINSNLFPNSVLGTTNQIDITDNGDGTITISTPQDIDETASPVFVGATLSGMTLGSILFVGVDGVISQDNAQFFWDNTNKRLGIGTAAPTGRLHLPAGTAIASNAPLKFETGVLLTTPEAGVMEFDGTGVYFTNTNHRRFLSLASDSIIATQTATTVASTTLWTGITNANELKAYRVYHVKGCGLVNNVSAAGVATVTINFGATAIITFTTPGAKLTNDPYSFEITVTVRTTGVSGTVSAFGTMVVNAITGIKTSHTVTESIVVNTTIANDITFKVTWSAANASNWLKLTQCWLASAD